MTLGLFIGRMNPPHNWHINTIEKAILENEKVLILLWSPIIEDKDNNPFTFLERKNLLKKWWKSENTWTSRWKKWFNLDFTCL